MNALFRTALVMTVASVIVLLAGSHWPVQEGRIGYPLGVGAATLVFSLFLQPILRGKQ